MPTISNMIGGFGKLKDGKGGKQNANAPKYTRQRPKGERKGEPTSADAVRKAGPEQLAVGDFVKIAGQEQTGQIQELSPKEALVAIGAIHIRVSRSKIEKTTKPKASSSNRTTGVIISRQTQAYFNKTLDLHGMTGEEAMEKVKSFLNEAYLRGESTIRIMHGKGSGTLRQLVRKYLANDTNIKSYRNEDDSDGGYGVTVVVL